MLVDSSLHPKASWEFDADIAILTHSTTIAPKYQAVIHCEIVRQAARVVAMDRERLRSGDREHPHNFLETSEPSSGVYMHPFLPEVPVNVARISSTQAHLHLRVHAGACVRFRFLQRPEYLAIGSRFVFREGRTKGIGVVMGV